MNWNNIVTTLRERAKGKWQAGLSPSPLSHLHDIATASAEIYNDIADIIETEMRRASSNGAVEAQIENYR